MRTSPAVGVIGLRSSMAGAGEPEIDEVEDVRTMARAIQDDGADLDDLIVLLEDGAGRLEVAAASAALPASLPVTAGTKLEDLVAQGDGAALTAARATARAGGTQRACRVRLGGPAAPGRWFEVRFVPGLVVDRLVVHLREVTRQVRLAGEAGLLRRVTELANAGSDIDEVAARAVIDIRTTMGWRAGHVLAMVDGTAVEAGGWDAESGLQHLTARLREVASMGATSVAVAAVDRVVPVTSGDIDDDHLAQLEGAGVATVVALPILAEGEVVRVLELFAGDAVVLDGDQRSLFAEVGRQLGSVMVRQRYLELLEASHRDLERSNAELERFAYVASHDLQEPLRKVIGFTELLQDRYEPRDDQEREFQGYVVDSAHRLQRLIKDLLAFSRAGRRELASEPVQLDAAMAGVCSDLGLAIEEADAVIEVGHLPPVVGDDGQLREVLQNLVANALKYRHEDRRPRIMVSGAVEGDMVRVVVADNGIGIAPAHRDEVFEVFRRLHPAHAYAGTGLGLALVQRIVERHGGTVGVDDSPLGDGIAVHVTLPRHLEQP